MKSQLFILSLTLLCISCNGKEGTGWTPDNLPDDPILEQPADSLDIHHFRAPLYWSVYEYAYVAEQSGASTIDMSESEWDRVIDWVSKELLPYGYDMLCTDGFMAMLATDESGYMTQYGSMDLSKLVAKCKAKGLRLGIYDNPLWIHGSDNTPIEGTSQTFGDLRYNDSDRDNVMYPDRGDAFTWAIPSHKGCKEYIDGFFKHYKDLGVEYIRMDFLCLFENAEGAGGMPGRGYGRQEYELALQYICESAKKYGIFTSLVMPNLFNDAELEKKYGNMVRIVADTFEGGWGHISERLRGQVNNGWPSCYNQFDGFLHWSHISGRGKVIKDGDFLRLNTLASDDEREFSVSLQLVAGGPVSIADQYNTIGNYLKFYTNEELLALNTDGFVGKPLSDDFNNLSKSQVWYGQMQNGDWIVGLFNREDNAQFRSINFHDDLGIEGNLKIRDLWKHADESEADNVTVKLNPHSCKIVKLTR